MKATMSKTEMKAMHDRMIAGEAAEERRRKSGEYDKYYRMYLKQCDALIALDLEEMIVDDIKAQREVFHRVLTNDVVREDEIRDALYALRYYRKVYEHTGDAAKSAQPGQNQDKRQAQGA
jgi:hypothetical protein